MIHRTCTAVGLFMALAASLGAQAPGPLGQPAVTLPRELDRVLRDYESAPFTVDSVTLFSSQLSPKGAVHTVRQLYPLG